MQHSGDVTISGLDGIAGMELDFIAFLLTWTLWGQSDLLLLFRECCSHILHMAQRISLPLTVSCFSKIRVGFTFLVPAHPGSPGQRAVKRVCVCVLQSL